MEELISNIYNILKDYRADEDSSSFCITKDHILAWINQFEENSKIPILTELENIFKKRYCSKKSVKRFLSGIITVFKKDFGFETEQEFLKNATFIDLQQEGKSQKIMLLLFDEIIQEKYGMKLSDCGSVSKKYCIYIDDILCTGLTLINDIKEWSEDQFSIDKTNLQAVADNSTTLVFAYIFIHDKNYYKKKAEMKFKISNEISSKHKMYRLIEVENNLKVASKLDLIIPLEQDQSQHVLDYKDVIIGEVDLHTSKYNKNSPDEFFRPSGVPVKEDFFTSPDNRKLLENVFLTKGMEILQKANVSNKNMRALGYSIPSSKNFGFGVLCFTWRNVPNNAPLVFWYSGEVSYRYLRFIEEDLLLTLILFSIRIMNDGSNKKT